MEVQEDVEVEAVQFSSPDHLAVEVVVADSAVAVASVEAAVALLAAAEQAEAGNWKKQTSGVQFFVHTAIFHFIMELESGDKYACYVLYKTMADFATKPN